MEEVREVRRGRGVHSHGVACSTQRPPEAGPSPTNPVEQERSQILRICRSPQTDSEAVAASSRSIRTWAAADPSASQPSGGAGRGYGQCVTPRATTS